MTLPPEYEESKASPSNKATPQRPWPLAARHLPFVPKLLITPPNAKFKYDQLFGNDVSMVVVDNCSLVPV